MPSRRTSSIAFERALMWWTSRTPGFEASEAAEGRAQAQLVKQSLDAAQTALRYWRVLKFQDPTVPEEAAAGTPPSGDDWNAQRKALEKAAIEGRRNTPGRTEACTLTRGARALEARARRLAPAASAFFFFFWPTAGRGSIPVHGRGGSHHVSRPSVRTARRISEIHTPVPVWARPRCPEALQLLGYINTRTTEE